MQEPKNLNVPWGGLSTTKTLQIGPVGRGFLPVPQTLIPPKAPESSSKPTNPKDMVGVRKAPMSTVSSAVMAEVGLAMLEGAAKYGRHNYRVAGVRASVYYDALHRHMASWWDEGEDIDPDSGLSHITKAIATLVVLRDAMINSKMMDDRPPSVPKGFLATLNLKAAAVIDRHADKAPRHYTIADTQGLPVNGDAHESLTFGALK